MLNVKVFKKNNVIKMYENIARFDIFVLLQKNFNSSELPKVKQKVA